MRWRFLLGLVAPLAILLSTVAYLHYEQSAARDGVIEPAALRWNVTAGTMTVRSERRVEGEWERFAIRFLLDGKPVHDTSFTIDHDMFGGGFVGGLDVDGDGVPELVLATRHGDRSRVLGPGPGGVLERGFDELPEDAARALAQRVERTAISPLAALIAAAAVLWFAVGCLIVLVSGLFRLLRGARGR